MMLVERYGFPGGSSIQMLDTFYGFFTHDAHASCRSMGQHNSVTDG
ncbi:hypothetical protein [Spirosoma radiotolerans]|nr:hypothetical protein [Spirosoma radiotolerans]